jgi:hypothetical protein
MNLIANYITQQRSQTYVNHASTVEINFVQTNSFNKDFAVNKASTAPKPHQHALKIYPSQPCNTNSVRMKQVASSIELSPRPFQDNSRFTKNLQESSMIKTFVHL